MVSRRDFLQLSAAGLLLPFADPGLVLRAQNAAGGDGLRLFAHGVASGDPLTDRVILWTRVTPPPTPTERRQGVPVDSSAIGPIDVHWLVAHDAGLTQVVARGTAPAAPGRDFTVKVDAGGLQPGRPYYYAFEAGGERSPVGRTKTLPARGGDRLRLASVSCSNYPAGYFNVYRCLANRLDLDAVVHLGDYIYEFANAIYGDGTKSGRLPAPLGEAVSLSDYRLRYATYHQDVDLQEARRVHPFITIWDDHEVVNDWSTTGAPTHTPDKGDWAARKAAAYRAYIEWMPVREGAGDVQLYRTFRFGNLADLVMVDTRGRRDPQVPGNDRARLDDPRRTLLGAAQEKWLAEQLIASRRAGTRWRVLGQQVLFANLVPPGLPALNVDIWDGYPRARERVIDLIERERIRDLAILTGDLHSSWALDVPRPGARYQPENGRGSLAVEFVTPAISSPPFFADPAVRERAALIRAAAPHLKYLEGLQRGYVLLDVTRNRLQADFWHVATVDTRSDAETRAASFTCERGSQRLARS